MTTLTTRITDLTTRIATECKTIRTLTNGNAADLSALTTTAKTSLVAALNELKAEIASVSTSIGASINDSAPASTTTTFSAGKITDLLTSAVNGLASGAPAALDTLKELADAIGDDANFAATVTTALGNRVRVDASQTLTTGQKAQARANIGADITSADIGTPDTDFVAVFTNGLA